METPKFIVNVEAAIYKDNQWLMNIRSSKEGHAEGTLSMIGGKIDYSESDIDTLEQGLKREVLEETGVEISDKLHYVESKKFVTAKGNHVIDIVFLAEYKSGEAKAMQEDESESVLWLTFDEIKEHSNTPPWILQSLIKAKNLKDEIVTL